MWLLPKLEKIQNLFLMKTNIDNVGPLLGSRLIFFLSVVGNFFLFSSVFSNINIFRPLSLLGKSHSHPRLMVILPTSFDHKETDNTKLSQIFTTPSS